MESADGIHYTMYTIYTPFIDQYDTPTKQNRNNYCNSLTVMTRQQSQKGPPHEYQ